MTEDEKKQHALRIAKDIICNADYSFVYEAEELEDASEEDLGDIYQMLFYVKVGVTDD